jgi:hypothetical protein
MATLLGVEDTESLGSLLSILVTALAVSSQLPWNVEGVAVAAVFEK